MRIKELGRRAPIEVPRRPRERRPTQRITPYYRDEFEVVPVREALGTLAVVNDLEARGRARVAEDEGRERAQLKKLGQLMGTLTAEVVRELIKHFIQHPPAQRAAAMVVLGELTGALLVEYWALASCDARSVLDRFVNFIEDTEGQPERRLAGTLYAL
jgi:hypothetical protein